MLTFGAPRMGKGGLQGHGFSPGSPSGPAAAAATIAAAVAAAGHLTGGDAKQHGGRGWSQGSWTCNQCGYRLLPYSAPTCQICGAHWRTRRPQASRQPRPVTLGNFFSPLDPCPPAPAAATGRGKGKGKGDGRRKAAPGPQAQSEEDTAEADKGELDGLRRSYADVVKVLGAQHSSATALASEIKARQDQQMSGKPLHVKLVTVDRKLGQNHKKAERLRGQVEKLEKEITELKGKLQEAKDSLLEVELAEQGLIIERDTLLAAGAKLAGIQAKPDFWKALGLRSPMVPKTFETAQLVQQFREALAGLRRCQHELAVDDDYGGQTIAEGDELFQHLLDAEELEERDSDDDMEAGGPGLEQHTPRVVPPPQPQPQQGGQKHSGQDLAGQREPKSRKTEETKDESPSQGDGC